MKKIKVLHIITHLPIGGAQDNTLITVEDLDRDRYDVHLLCSKTGEWAARAEKIPGMKLIDVPELVREIHPLFDVIAFFKIFRIIRREKYRIVHTHSSKPGFTGRLAAKLAGTPVIVHTIHGFPFHDFMHPVIRQSFILLERLVSRWTDKLITVSKLNLEKAVSLRIAPSEKFINIYSGIRLEQFRSCAAPEKLKAELNISPEERIVGFVGRLSEQKSPHYLIQAIPDILEKHPKIRFLIVGDGELRAKLTRMTRQLGITNSVCFAGYRDDIPDLLAIMDVYVLCSLWEGLGRSLTEAMIMGVPVVATAVEGVPELVQTKKTGILVAPKNSRQLAEGVNYLIDHPDEAGKMGKAAQNHVVRHFAAAAMVADIETLYQKMIKD